MNKVLIATRLDAVARETLEATGNYEVVQEDSGELIALAEQHADAQTLIVRSEPVTAEVIDAFPELQVIVRAGAGVNTIDTQYARQKGVDVMNTPAANSNAVAEEVIALILADARHVIEGDTTTRAGKWEKKRLVGRELAGKTVGVVGLGHIGQLVARRLSGFDVRLLGIDPLITATRAEELDVELVDLPTLFAESDYVSLHVPENDETREMVGESLLSVMKPGATIVNCARAGIIDEEALRAARQAKSLRFLNDVYAKDAPGPKSVSDIADIMLPHLGASTQEAGETAARRAAEQLIEFSEQGVTSYIVNREIPHGLDEDFCQLANVLARLCRGLSGQGALLKAIETSFYGALEEYADWLLVPIVTGLWEEVQQPLDFMRARSTLSDRGIEYFSRKVDPHKGYENSITIDLTSSVPGAELRCVSVRGTIAEGRLMVSRINDFDKLYLEPFGCTAFFEYVDRPGVLGQLGISFAEAGINIEDVRNPHNTRTGLSLATMKLNQVPAPELIDKLSRQIEALSAFCVSL